MHLIIHSSSVTNHVQLNLYYGHLDVLAVLIIQNTMYLITCQHKSINYKEPQLLQNSIGVINSSLCLSKRLLFELT